VYLLRRNGVYWFRKVHPINVANIFGQAEVRCSLRTNRRDVARRRATQLLVALEHVYEVLRSQRPLEPARQLIADFARDALENGASTIEINPTECRLQEAVDALCPVALPAPAPSSQTLVSIDDVDVLLQEQPPGEPNQVAAELLRLAVRIRRSNGWAGSKRASALVSLCQRLVAVSETAPLDAPASLQAIRNIIREEISRASQRTTVNKTPQVDAASLREIVAGEIRAGVAAAGRDRWSSEQVSTMIEKFLESRYPSENGKSKVGSKHREDVERRLAAFVRFVGDKPVRDITRDDLKRYRDVLDQLPDRFELRLKTPDMRLAIEKNNQKKVPFRRLVRSLST
jgi:hypothetical protein